jgi:hypothetical protein
LLSTPEAAGPSHESTSRMTVGADDVAFGDLCPNRLPTEGHRARHRHHLGLAMIEFHDVLRKRLATVHARPLTQLDQVRLLASSRPGLAKNVHRLVCLIVRP